VFALLALTRLPAAEAIKLWAINPNFSKRFFLALIVRRQLEIYIAA
jgi:hypothetical protein